MTGSADRLSTALADRYATERELGAGGPLVADFEIASLRRGPRREPRP